MDISIKMLFITFVIVLFSLLLVDFNSNLQMKQDAYESVRAANQNALLDLQNNYEDYDELNTPAMIERWLANFVNNENLSWQEIKIKFIQVVNDPPTYLLEVKGDKKSGYAIVKKDAYIKFHSGSTIISDREELEED